MLQQLQQMQQYFKSGATLNYKYRIQKLQALKHALYAYEQELYHALYTDLKKNKEESWITEIGFVVAEINYAIKHLQKWMRPQLVTTNLINQLGKSYVLPQPLGVVLIIAPWNYPVNLLLTPLVGAMAAGNCVMLKPSELAPATASVLHKLIEKSFEPQYVGLAEGSGAEIIPQMMESFRFDHVFFTGGEQVGKAIYKMAAEKLVPVTLELGGKSPCIVEDDADIKVAAKRVALTKFSNAGQMCVAPDYLIVHQKVKDKLVAELIKHIESFYNGKNVRDYNYGKIINEKQVQRLKGYLQSGEVIYGGRVNEAENFIEPTLLQNVSLEDEVMQAEIFGPILPILTWQHKEEVYNIIEKNIHPLALYVFTSNNKKADEWMRTISFGGGCINNASLHLTNPALPFGGVGSSGFGQYHGRYTFNTFSHQKAIMKTATWFDAALKYPPFNNKLSIFKRIIR